MRMLQERLPQKYPLQSERGRQLEQEQFPFHQQDPSRQVLQGLFPKASTYVLQHQPEEGRHFASPKK